METILDFSRPFDVPLLDNILRSVYESTDEKQRALAQAVLTKFKEHPDAWTKVDEILQKSDSQATKFFALQVLQPVIQFHWKALPRDQCDAIKTFIVDKVVKISSVESTLRSEKLYLQKLNETLVQIIKQEWPRNWTSFIMEIINSSKTNESLCENNMVVLKLLSEEVFDFAQGKMTAAKTQELKQQFSKEFASIYQLCELVLIQSQKPSLLAVALEALLGFLSWIPIGYIFFETQMIKLLVERFLPVAMFRNSALRCLTEIGSLRIESEHSHNFVKLLLLVMNKLVTIIPVETDIAAAYVRGSGEDKKFIQNLALFFSGLFREHLSVCEAATECHECLVIAHQYLAKISFVDDDEIFKICLEYWNTLASDLYYNDYMANSFATGFQSSALMLSNTNSRGQQTSRLKLYAPILSSVRIALITRMAKPEEVLLVEDDNGELYREVLPDTEAILLYNSMRETLLFLTHVNSQDTINKMKERLNEQVGSSDWSWNKLNTLCWAIGSISGAQPEDEEKHFLVFVIRELLTMCENTRGKDNKAVIATNIMYIVGQYPRFLQSHWKFLRTVVKKLFEFMHEKFAGVREMACDTFLKIAKSCQQQFALQQEKESQPFICEIIMELDSIIKDLEAEQVQIFYEAVGYMIAAHRSELQVKPLIEQLMIRPNAQWREIIAQVSVNVELLREISVAKQIALILRLNIHVASSLGSWYKHQLGPIFFDILQVYRLYSESISNIIAAQGPSVTKHSNVRAYRSVKREILRVLATFIDHSDDEEFLSKSFVPPLFSAVLGDYQSNIPDARDPEVLALMTALVNKLKVNILNEIPTIFASVFECTIQMIQTNFEDYPEQRVNFFNLVRAINEHCFAAFFKIPPRQFKLAVDSVVWALKHTMRNIASTGLSILIQLWKNIQTSEAATAFYKTYLLSLLQDIFVVLTDTMHKPGFAMHATILMMIFQTVKADMVTVPLWGPEQQFANNQQFVHSFVTNLIGTAFNNLTPNQVQQFVTGLFAKCEDLPSFKQHLRDFLVNMNEFGEDNADLYLEELEAQQRALQLKREQVPGLVKPPGLAD